MFNSIERILITVSVWVSLRTMITKYKHFWLQKPISNVIHKNKKCLCSIALWKKSPKNVGVLNWVSSGVTYLLAVNWCTITLIKSKVCIGTRGTPGMVTRRKYFITACFWRYVLPVQNIKLKYTKILLF